MLPSSCVSAAAWDLLAGRTAERNALLDVVCRLTGGAGRLVWLAGEAGIGKSALVDALVAEAAMHGIPVFRGRADELGQPFPLDLLTPRVGVSVRSVDPGLLETTRAVPVGASGTRVLDPVLAANDAVAELVDGWCAEGPVLLVAEDLHWSDLPSLAVFERLGCAVDRLPLMLVGTSRPSPRRPEVTRLRDVVAERAGLMLHLKPLDAPAVAELAGRLMAVAPGPDLVVELSRAGGNPLHVRELVADLIREGLVEVADGTVRLRVHSTPRPVTPGPTSRRRLNVLHPRTRSVLRLAALLGDVFEVRELAVVAGCAADVLVAPLEEAVTEGVLVEAGDRLTFRYPSIREALAGEMPASVRDALHSQFARALAEADAPVGAVMRHLLAVRCGLDGWAPGWLAELPTDAMFVQPQAAAELLSRALRSPACGGRRDVLLTRLATTLFWLGDDARAGELAAEAVRTIDDPDMKARMQLYRVRVAERLGHNESAVSVAGSAVADERVPEVWRARIRAWSAAALMKLQRRAVAHQQVARALADGSRLGDALTVGYARHVLSHLVTGAAALAYVDAGLAASGTGPDAMELRLLLLNNRLVHLANLGRRVEFEATVGETLTLAGSLGMIRAAEVRWAAAVGCYDFGAWDEALGHLDSLQPPLNNSTLIGRHGLAALIAAHREQWARMREHACAGSAEPTSAGDVGIYSGYLTAAQAIRAQADGEPIRAVGLLAGSLDAGAGSVAGDRSMWLPDLVRLALAVGDAAAARAAVEAAEADAATPEALPRHHAAAQLCRGQLVDDVALMRAAAAAYHQHGWPIGHASALEEVAVRLAMQPDVDAARAALTDAVRVYTSVGATWDVRRADSRLRRHGIRRGPRSLHRRSASGWAALTPTELRVAELVAQGRSNPEIAAELCMSRRTAQAHVSHILSKLTLRSRIEIIRVVAGLG